MRGPRGKAGAARLANLKSRGGPSAPLRRARELDPHEIGGPKQIVRVGARLEQFAGTVEADARVCQAVGDVGKEARARNYVDGLGPATATSLGVRRPEGDLLKGGDQSVDHQRPPRRH